MSGGFFNSGLFRPNIRPNSFQEMTWNELVMKFRSNWGNMRDPEKMQLLQATGDAYAKKRGIERPPRFRQIHTTDEDRAKGIRVYGGYAGGYFNTISVNLENCSNPYEALDTVFHEENHAYQAQCIRNGEGYSEGALALMKAQSGQEYISNGEGYNRQSLEIDSNNAGLRGVMQEHDKFSDDPQYHEYLQDRQHHFEHVLNDYNNASEECRATEQRQVENAYHRGILSESEYDAATDFVNSNDGIHKECEMLHMEAKNAYDNATEYESIKNNSHYQQDVKPELSETRYVPPVYMHNQEAVKEASIEYLEPPEVTDKGMMNSATMSEHLPDKTRQQAADNKEPGKQDQRMENLVPEEHNTNQRESTMDALIPGDNTHKQDIKQEKEENEEKEKTQSHSNGYDR